MRKLFLILAFFSANSFAVDYWYTADWRTSTQHNTPLSACQELVPILATNNNWQNATVNNAVLNYGVNWNCNVTISNLGTFLVGGVVRQGTECPPDSTYNSETGACEGDPCLSTAGQTIGNRVTMGIIQATGNTISHNDPPGVVCQNSCQYAWNGSHAAKIYRFVEGLDNSIYGDYIYQGNGVSCTEATETPPPPIQITATDPKREKADSCADVVIDPQGGGTSQLCTSTDEYKNPGALSCGQLNDKWVCTAGNPSPIAAKKTVTTETTKTDNPDGSKTEQKSIVTVVKTCNSITPCDSKTSTKTETSGTGSGGESTGGSSTCEGELCNSTGGDSPELAEEDVEPKCDPATDPDGCGQSSLTGGIVCGDLPVCKGDAIQCALVAQNYNTQCFMEENNDYEGKRNDIDALFTGDEYQEGEGLSVDLQNIFDTGTRFLPSACPADSSFSVMGRTMAITWAPMCTLANILSYLIVSMAALFFIRYVGSAA